MRLIRAPSTPRSAERSCWGSTSPNRSVYIFFAMVIRPPSASAQAPIPLQKKELSSSASRYQGRNPRKSPGRSGSQSPGSQGQGSPESPRVLPKNRSKPGRNMTRPGARRPNEKRPAGSASDKLGWRGKKPVNAETALMKLSQGRPSAKAAGTSTTGTGRGRAKTSRKRQMPKN